MCAAPLTAPRTAAQEPPARLTVDRIFLRNEFRGAPMPDVHWLPDGRAWVELRPAAGGGTDIVRVDAASGETTVLADVSTLVGADGHPLDVEEITLSDDGRRALLFHNSVRVWRDNTRGLYSVIDFATKHVTTLSPTPGLQMFATFSPDGRQVAFVRANDLWVVTLATGAERRLTTDGSDVIINGTTDWVYEEELGLRDAFRWSPDSKRIAYWRFDQSPVPEYPLVDYMHLYPTVQTLRYPKAGEPNSRVTIGVLTLGTGRTAWLDVAPDTGVYITRMDWADADSLVIQRVPRVQNRIDLLMVNATTGGMRTITTARDSAWLDDDAWDQPVWVHGGAQFLWPIERGGWHGYGLFNRDGTFVRRVTSDSATATALAGVDEARGSVYVVMAAPTPRERQLYRFPLAAGPGTRITRRQGTHDPSIAPGARFMVDVHSTIATPPTASLFALPSARPVRVLERNAALAAQLAALDVRPPQFFHIPIDSGVSLPAYRIVPPDFDSTRTYPVLVYLYGGPNSQEVADAYGGSRYLWHQLLAQRGYVVVTIDNRGTGMHGRDWEKITYLRLGETESRDQVAAARWLATQPWVDGNRIGIWGWSYGGFMAARTAERGGPLYKMAISVAPVTDLRFYDTIYTERYMRTPRENPRGYVEAAPIAHVADLTARYLLVFGTGDDNVHPQNAIVMANALEGAGKQFRTMFYPNRTHAISGGNTQAHLFTLLTAFVLEEL